MGRTIVYCYKCGATPPTNDHKCLGGDLHKFTQADADAVVYCYLCGAVPGVASQCPVGSQHQFTKA